MPSVQLRLMREMPATLDAALSFAVQQQSVETAQQCILKEIHRGDAVAMPLQQRGKGKRERKQPQTQCRRSELAEFSILDLMKFQKSCAASFPS